MNSHLLTLLLVQVIFQLIISCFLQYPETGGDEWQVPSKLNASISPCFLFTRAGTVRALLGGEGGACSGVSLSLTGSPRAHVLLMVQINFLSQSCSSLPWSWSSYKMCVGMDAELCLMCVCFQFFPMDCVCQCLLSLMFWGQAKSVMHSLLFFLLLLFN